MDEDEKSKSEAVKGFFNLKRILVNPASPPVVAHHLAWTRIGNEYTLDVGHYDPVMVREAIKKAAKPDDASEVDLYITHQFTLSADAMQRFVDGLDGLKGELKQVGPEKSGRGEDEHSEDEV